MSVVGQSPSFSVSEFVAVFNQTLEFAYPVVSIVGEVSNFRLSKNRWIYFDLKDQSSSLKCFSSVSALAAPLENGMSIEVLGRPRLHNLYGFSINVDRFRAVGEGSIKKAQDLLKAKLQAAGLFDVSRKRNLPYPPERIAVVTSVESAAIGDFLKIIQARWPILEVEVVDTPVQGIEAPSKIAAAILESSSSSYPPDVIVVVRGGGSADDLAAYSDEIVVRAIASSRVPTLVAVGHERDVSLAELAADVRASTPSNAAEILVPNIEHESQVMSAIDANINGLLNEKLKQAAGLNKYLTSSLASLFNSKVEHQKIYLKQRMELLGALDPGKPLQKGYALIRSDDEKIIKSGQRLGINDTIKIQFYDSELQAKIVQSGHKND